MNNMNMFKNDKRQIIEGGFNMKLIGKHPRGKPRSRWEQHVRKDVV
jgi:thiamine biosynthesis lipoprotein ApbE